MAQRDSSPVYYREIQKHAYLKRMPDEGSGKLRPLSLKKAPLKKMWTQLCVHNGRTPYLEQYQDPTSTRSHRPAWRASLATARHVTASVTPRDTEYDFLIDTHQGPVRMLAPTWEDMQDWVTTLRNKLHELKILPLCENVYMAPPVPPAPRAAARDPTSPLPPTPPLPPDRVPGIDLTSVTRTPAIPETPEPITPEPPTSPLEPPISSPEPPIDISNWDELSLPSTSQAPTSVAKICGQNICLDDSIFKRGESDDEFTDCDSEGSYRQTVVVGRSKEAEDLTSERPSNITVIQVSNKEAPHTAIPVIGTETDIFNFELKTAPDFINIVNTENVQNDYGTVFTDNESDYGHLSLTTTVSLTGDVTVKNEDLYERLCLASTKPSPLPVKRLKSVEKVRKSSLPNLDTVNSTYEYLFLSQNNNTATYDNVTPQVTQSASISTQSAQISSQSAQISTQSAQISGQSAPVTTQSSQIPSQDAPISSNVTSISTNSTSVIITSTSNVTSTEINSNRHINSVAIVDSDSRGISSNIERTQSQNSYDSLRRERRQNEGQKSNGKVEKSDAHKPIWKRGLTELSLLTRLRGIGHGKRPESPIRNTDNNDRNGITSPVKVVHRSRTEARADRSRRRSSSLTNGQSPPSTSVPSALQPLRARQAAALIAAQRRGAAMVACISTTDPPIFADYNKQVWIAWWGSSGVRCNGRTGDRVVGLRANAPRDAAHAKLVLHSSHARAVDILFHRVPLAKIYVITKRDQEHLGIKLDSECNIVCVERDSPAARAGVPPPAGRWALTEVNNRPLNLLKCGEDDMNRISLNGTETSILLQPSAFVKKLRAALKGNKTLLGLR